MKIGDILIVYKSKWGTFITNHMGLRVEDDDGYEDCYLEARERVAYRGQSAYGAEKTKPTVNLFK